MPNEPDWIDKIKDGDREAKAREAARQRAIKGRSRPRTGTKSEGESAYARAALERERRAVAEATKGTREVTVNAALLSLGRHIEAGKLDEHEVRREIESACYVNGFIQEDYGGSAKRFWEHKGDRSLADGKAKGARDYSTVGTQTAPDPNVVEVTGEEFASGKRKRPPGKRRRIEEFDEQEEDRIVVTMKSMGAMKSAVAQWVWEHEDTGYIELGEIVVLGGKGAVGKSTVARWIAAQITRGTLPGAWLGHPMNVAALFFEETLETRVIPGLQAAGADMNRMYFPDITIDGNAGEFHLVRDEQRIIKSLVDKDIRAVIFDPVMNLVGAGVDSNKSNEVRPMMAALKRIAEAIDGFVLLVTHLNKGSNRDVIESITGSGAFNQYPRQVILFMEKDTDDPLAPRVMEQRKNNSGKPIGPMEYNLHVELVEVEGFEREMTVFNLIGPSKVSLRDIVDGNLDGDDGGSRVSDCIQWLESFLHVEQPVPAKVVYAAAFSADTFSKSTVDRAKKKLRIHSRPHNDAGKHQWVWALPEYWKYRE